MPQYLVEGCGLGLRRGLFDQLKDHQSSFYEAVDFIECAPENWIGVGGSYGEQFRTYADHFPIVCHGLSLSLGSPAPLAVAYLQQVKQFLDSFNVAVYGDHLSYCSDEGQLYDLMPIPFCEDAVIYVADRIRQAQEILERTLTVEHISYYAAPGQILTELEFINAVVEEADCRLLLDVNNIYVNSINFRYDASEFLRGLPGERISYIHIAGHAVESPDLRIDSHGSPVIDPVWDLLREAYETFGVIPTLLERDFNFPQVSELFAEVERIRQLQQDFTTRMVGA